MTMISTLKMNVTSCVQPIQIKFSIFVHVFFITSLQLSLTVPNYKSYFSGPQCDDRAADKGYVNA